MNSDKNGIYMSTVTHQYALIGGTLFQFKKIVAHVSEPHSQIVICGNGPDIRYATLEEWEKAGESFDRRAQVEGVVTSASQRATNSSSFAISLLAAKMFTPMGTAEKTGESAIRPPAQTSGSQAFVPKQIVRKPNARNAATASSPS